MIFVFYLIVLALIILPAMDYFLGLLILPDAKPSGGVDSRSPLALDGISAVIACHNEAEHIGRKVLEIIQQFKDAGISNYEIVVVSDGSEDGSNEILQDLADKRLIIYDLIPERQGKPNALNRAISLSKYPLLLCSDVRQTFSKNAVSLLLSHLSDPEVGAVTSQLELEGDASPTRRLMNGLKYRESRKGSTTGMCGALYVIRKSLTSVLPTDLILDDLVMALLVMKADKRVVLEPRAIVHDINWNLFYSGRRQGRITAGLVQLLRKHRSLVFGIGLKQFVFLYGQKYMKYVSPILFLLASFIAIFEDNVRLLHFGISGAIFLILLIWRPKFIGETLRLVLSYLAQLLKLDKYRKIRWER
jgi:cellulose synthase/poly-beta-1,6-N-acetylglucosamine synthase-like glycosyltransferase